MCEHGHAMIACGGLLPVWVLGVSLTSSALVAVTSPAEPPHQPGRELWLLWSLVPGHSLWCLRERCPPMGSHRWTRDPWAGAGEVFSEGPSASHPSSLPLSLFPQYSLPPPPPKPWVKTNISYFWSGNRKVTNSLIDLMCTACSCTWKTFRHSVVAWLTVGLWIGLELMRS